MTFKTLKLDKTRFLLLFYDSLTKNRISSSLPGRIKNFTVCQCSPIRLKTQHDAPDVQTQSMSASSSESVRKLSGINSSSMIADSFQFPPIKASPAHLQKSISLHLTAARCEPSRGGIKGTENQPTCLFTNLQLEGGARGNLAEAPREHEIPIPESQSVNAP